MREKYGQWTVIEVKRKSVYRGSRNRNVEIWVCQCSCGAVKEQEPSNLVKGRSTMCGKCSGKKRAKHSLYDHKLYSIWEAMKQRCCNPKSKYYPRYGGRGVIICEEWREDPARFVEWALQAGWREGLQLDRIDNEGGYEPANCRFITQQQNLRNTRLLTTRNKSGYRGVSKYADGKFHATARFNNIAYKLGVYSTAEEAAEARDKFVVECGLPLPLNLSTQGEDVSRFISDEEKIKCREKAEELLKSTRRKKRN